MASAGVLTKPWYVSIILTCMSVGCVSVCVCVYVGVCMYMCGRSDVCPVIVVGGGLCLR